MAISDLSINRKVSINGKEYPTQRYTAGEEDQ